MKNMFCIVMTTVENFDQAYELIDKILERKLAACIQSREIESHYVWEGKICHDKEILIWFKTEKLLYEELKSTLENIHPYDCPEIISVPIENASESYGKWIQESIKH